MSFSLGINDLSKLEQVHPDLGQAVERAAVYSQTPFVVEQGLRGQHEQAAALASGHSRTLKGKHLRQLDGFAHAVDLVPVVNGILLWQLPPPHQWDFIWPLAAAMQRAGRELGVPIGWGGDWRHELEALPPGAEALREASATYSAWFARRFPNEKVFLDGVHFQLGL